MLKELNNKIDECEKCDLCKLETNILNINRKEFGKLLLNHKIENSNNIRLLFIGICPSYRRFDIKRRAFEGISPSNDLKTINTSGDFFYYVLRKSKLINYDIWITNLVKCSTDGNSSPTDIQINACKKLLFEEINILKPDYLIAMGNLVFFYLNKFKLNNKIFSINHPSFYFRFKNEKYINIELKEFNDLCDKIKKDKSILRSWL